MMLDQRGAFPDTIPGSLYVEVVEKICSQKKNVFWDFIYAGSLLKVAIFHLMNKIYKEEEQVPESMKNSYLTKIFKKKGNPSDLKCNRFIHDKDWFSKLTEKCLVKVIEPEMNMATPAQQIGGMKGQGTTDHILDVSCMMRAKESKGEPFRHS